MKKKIILTSIILALSMNAQATLASNDNHNQNRYNNDNKHENKHEQLKESEPTILAPIAPIAISNYDFNYTESLITDLKNKISLETNGINVLKQDLSLISKNIKDINGQISAINSEIEAQEAHLVELNNTTLSFTVLDGQIAELEAQKSKLESSLKNLMGLMEIQTIKLNRVDSTITNMETDIINIKNRISEIETQLLTETDADVITSLGFQLRSLDYTLAKTEYSLTYQVADKVDIEVFLSGYELELASLQDTLNQTTWDLEQLQAEKDALINGLINQILDTETLISEKVIEKNELENKINSLNQEAAFLNSEIANKSALINRWNSEISRLSSEMEAARSAMQETELTTAEKRALLNAEIKALKKEYHLNKREIKLKSKEIRKEIFEESKLEATESRLSYINSMKEIRSESDEEVSDFNEETRDKIKELKGSDNYKKELRNLLSSNKDFARKVFLERSAETQIIKDKFKGEIKENYMSRNSDVKEIVLNEKEILAKLHDELRINIEESITKYFP